MHKFFTAVVTLFAAGMLLGNALAQQTPAPSTPPASPSSASPAKAQTPAAKPHTAAAAKTPAPLVLKTQKDKFSYALGMKMGANLQKQSVPVDPAILARGLKDGLAGGKTLLTDDEAQAALKAMQSGNPVARRGGALYRMGFFAIPTLCHASFGAGCARRIRARTRATSSANANGLGR